VQKIQVSVRQKEVTEGAGENTTPKRMASDTDAPQHPEAEF